MDYMPSSVRVVRFVPFMLLFVVFLFVVLLWFLADTELKPILIRLSILGQRINIRFTSVLPCLFRFSRACLGCLCGAQLIKKLAVPPFLWAADFGGWAHPRGLVGFIRWVNLIRPTWPGGQPKTKRRLFSF